MLNKCYYNLLSACYVSGNELKAGDTEIGKLEKVLVFTELISQFESYWHKCPHGTCDPETRGTVLELAQLPLLL